MDAKNLADLYDLPPLDWSSIERRLGEGLTQWAEGGWPARVDDSGTAITAEYSAPSAGPPPWHVYRLVPHRATALQTVEPGGATRWTF